MSRKHTNLHTATTLSGAINASVTTIPLTSTAGLPVTYPYDLILEIGTAQIEIVAVTASAGGNNLTVTRGQDGTTAQSHNAGATVVHGVVARDVQEPLDHIDASTNIHGLSGGAAVVGTTQAQTLTNKTISGASNTLSAIGNVSLVAIDGSKVTMPIPTLTVTNNATVGGTLGITGTTTAAAVNATSLSASTTLAVTTNATIGGTLGVTGTTTLGVVNSGNHGITGTLTVSGLATLSANATVGGTLGVTGATTLAGLSCTTLAASSNATVGGTLGITGATTAAAVTGTTLNGTTDVQRNGVSLPRGYITEATVTADNAATAETVFISVSFTAVAGRRYKVSFMGHYTSTVHNDIITMRLKYQSGASMTAGGSTTFRSISPSTVNPSPPGGGSWVPVYFDGTTTALGSGTFTVGMTFQRTTGTGNTSMIASATNVSRLEVEDVGT